MLNNIGFPGLITLVVVIGLPIWLIWLIIRPSKRKSKEQARIAEALEQLSKSKEQEKKD